MLPLVLSRIHTAQDGSVAVSKPMVNNGYHPRSLFGWLVTDGWCWFVLREKYCWRVAGGWFVLREKYCWLVANKPNEQGARSTKPGANV
jgi:hypothetical protein